MSDGSVIRLNREKPYTDENMNENSSLLFENTNEGVIGFGYGGRMFIPEVMTPEWVRAAVALCKSNVKHMGAEFGFEMQTQLFEIVLLYASEHKTSDYAGCAREALEILKMEFPRETGV